jgi:hypothetical protein
MEKIKKWATRTDINTEEKVPFILKNNLWIAKFLELSYPV